MPKFMRGRARLSQSPYASQSQYGASQSGARRSVKYGRVARIARGPASVTPSFTETYALAGLAINTGGVFTASMSSIPQLADYSALYRTYRILGFEVIVMPQAIVNTSDGGTGSWVQRLTHAWDKSAEVATPTSETDVLNDNSCVVSLLNKPLRIKCLSPKPAVRISNEAGGLTGVDLGRQNWLSFDDGSAIRHFGMPYWLDAGTSASNQPPIVYVKVRFQCRDPR